MKYFKLFGLAFLLTFVISAVVCQGTGADIASTLITATVFPMWWQPNPGIGQILVHSNEQLAELEARDWTPKPLPGSEIPRKSSVTDQLAADRLAFEAEKAAFMASIPQQMKEMVDQRLAEAGLTTGGPDPSSPGESAPRA